VATIKRQIKAAYGF